MKLNSETRYGMRALVELAQSYPTRLVTIGEVAERQHLSVKYLEQIFRQLKKAGLVRAVRGSSGGYSLARPPGEIHLDEIYKVLEGSWAVVHCVDDPESCPYQESCPTYELWCKLTESILSVLEKTVLQDLVEKRFPASVKWV